MLISCVILTSIFKCIYNPDSNFVKKFQIRVLDSEIEFGLIYNEELFACCTISSSELEEFDNSWSEILISEEIFDKLLLLCRIYKKDFIDIGIFGDMILFKLKSSPSKIENDKKITITIHNNSDDVIYKPISYKYTFRMSTDILCNLLEIAYMNNEDILITFNKNILYIKNSENYIESCVNVFDAKDINVVIKLDNKTIKFITGQLNKWPSKICNVYMSKTSLFIIEIDNVQIYAVHDPF